MIDLDEVLNGVVRVKGLEPSRCLQHVKLFITDTE